MKTRWFIPVVLVLLITTTVFSAMAYFSAQQSTSGTISSGTLTLKLSNDGVNFYNSVALPWDVSNMAPGDEVEGTLYLKNTGSIDANKVWWDWDDVLNDPADRLLAQHIYITSIYDNMDTGEQVAAVVAAIDGKDGSTPDGKGTLLELASIGGSGPDAYSPTNNHDEPFLPAGTDPASWLYMKLQFDPDAGNDLQGATMTYDLIIEATQQ